MKNTILVYIIFTLLASCYLPVESEYAIIEETPVESDEDLEDEIIIIQEVHSMELQPIKEYEGYVKQASRLFGISDNQLEEIKVLDAEGKEQPLEKFFVVDGMIYLSVEVREQGNAIPDSDPVVFESVLVEYFFMQSKGEISIRESIPNMPPSERVQFSDTKYQINNFMYGDLETSRVCQMPIEEAYLKVNGFKRTAKGLWFSVPESYSSRLKGVYFWALEAGGTTRVKDEGRVY